MSAKSNLGWPSFGFFVLGGTHALLGGMLLWGWQRPPLDQAFEILTRRDSGEPIEFSQAEVQVLQRSMDRHAGFTRALLGKSATRFLEPTESGWLSRAVAHLTVRPEPDRPTQLLLEGRGAPNDFPLVVKLHGKGLDRRVELSPNQPQKIEWSTNDLKQPSILDIDVTTASNHAAAGAPSWAIRVSSSSPARETQ